MAYRCVTDSTYKHVTGATVEVLKIKRHFCGLKKGLVCFELVRQ